MNAKPFEMPDGYTMKNWDNVPDRSVINTKFVNHAQVYVRKIAQPEVYFEIGSPNRGRVVEYNMGPIVCDITATLSLSNEGFKQTIKSC